MKLSIKCKVRATSHYIQPYRKKVKEELSILMNYFSSNKMNLVLYRSLARISPKIGRSLATSGENPPEKCPDNG